MKRVIRNTLLLCICMLTAALTACQPTPDAPIVVQKDMEQMLEKADRPENGVREAALPDIPQGRYTFSATGLDGRLRIAVNAEITVPETTAMPIVRVKRGGFPQELVTKLFNHFYAGETAYDASSEHVETKAEIEPLIIDAKRRLADGSYAEYGYTEEEYTARLKRIEERYSAAPETAPALPISNGTMHIQELENIGDYLLLNVDNDTVSDTARTMNVLTPNSRYSANSGFGTHLYYRVHSRTKKTVEYNSQGILRTDGKNLPEAARKKLTISFNEAKALCDDMFAAAELSDDYKLGHAFLVGDTGTGVYSGDGKELGTPAENYAYRLYYTRMINGIPCFVNTDIGLDDSNNGTTSLPWYYEYISFTVDNSGLTYLSWHNPIEIMDTVTENAALLPFNDIIDVFEAMIRIEYEAFLNKWTDGSGEMDINIDTVELCLVRVRERDSEATGLLVPAWVFYGNNTVVSNDGSTLYDFAHGNASSWNKEPFPILIINAVDGSTIDLGRGY